MKKYLKRLNKKLLAIIFLTLGIILIIYAIYLTPFVQNNRYVKAYRIERAADKFPVGSSEYLRLKAIAEAVRNGQKNFIYTPGFNPITMPVR